MSAIFVSALVHSSFRIDGMERAHMGRVLQNLSGFTGLVREDRFHEMLNAAMEIEPACRLIARLHGGVELGCWVAGEDCRWFAELLRESLETAVRVHYGQHGSTQSEALMRVPQSVNGYKPSLQRSMVMPGDGTVYPGWLHLYEWLRHSPESLDSRVAIVFWYTTSGRPWNEPVNGWGLRAKLIEQGAPRLQPDGWDDCMFGES